MGVGVDLAIRVAFLIQFSLDGAFCFMFMGVRDDVLGTRSFTCHTVSYFIDCTFYPSVAYYLPIFHPSARNVMDNVLFHTKVRLLGISCHLPSEVLSFLQSFMSSFKTCSVLLVSNSSDNTLSTSLPSVLSSPLSCVCAHVGVVY